MWAPIGEICCICEDWGADWWYWCTNSLSWAGVVTLGLISGSYCTMIRFMCHIALLLMKLGIRVWSLYSLTTVVSVSSSSKSIL
ncbi:hypothetical protein BDV26DRAFT_190367 [Aspergillus bertholletiae]|uniref:Uncharacterized protein n=1 Tax=Aspergillus bertholletiae TaxID=1226010 RepID=A0A5N7B9K0_9EURO|nr:hypothetical protein BDV26DRAFT_190367 [Aspergillus bertholletiae]